MKKYRCKDCDAEFDEKYVEDCNVCPSCGSVRPPLDVAHDILLPMNWYELRCLTIWASNWIDSRNDGNINDTKIWLQKLLNRIHKHKPEGGGALTVAQEIKEIQKSFPHIELRYEHGEIIIPPKEEME